MAAPMPSLADYDVSVENGFLPTDPPLDHLPDPYYKPWEDIIQNLQGLILSNRLRGVVDKLPVLSTEHLTDLPQWRRAYSILGFITHAYIWSGKRPAQRIPPPITIPFMQTCSHLELPPVATYAGLVLWNWKPLFASERTDTLANLDMLHTFTGSLDEKWFYLVSVAIEARGAPLIPLMLSAIEAARRNDTASVTESLRTFAERLDELGALLTKMHDHCDPHVFYNRIRPYLSGSKNMAEAGLPNGVVFDNGGAMNKQRYVQFSGGSNAQSSIIQFFDLVLSVEHRPTGEKAPSPSSQQDVAGGGKKTAPPSANFIHEMRKYMPGPHARFLAEVAKVANIRSFVEEHSYDRGLSIAFDACLAMLSALRDKHIQIVSRYIIIQSQAAKKRAANEKPSEGKQELPHRPKSDVKGEKKDLKGTGGSSLIPFLRQARDETGERAVDVWARRVLSKEKGPAGVELSRIERRASRAGECPGLAQVWGEGEGGGGLCFT